MQAMNVAWAAGLFEGEGCWGLRKDGRNPYAALKMADRDVVERFASIVGFGSMSITERRSKNPKHSDMWCWQVFNAPQVRQLINLFRPYLGTRRLAAAERILVATTGVGGSIYTGRCKQGHSFDAQNTSYRRFKRRNGTFGIARSCKRCHREGERRRRKLAMGG
jgi:hypothetical protein